MKNKKIYVSNGNRKIPKDTLIFNMTSATDCPSRKLGLCKHCNICYAMKAERLYPYCLPFRRKQAKQWSNISPESFFKRLCALPKVKKGNIKYLRFSESGDFRHIEDVKKMNSIADMTTTIGIKVYGYTARYDLIDKIDFKLSHNITINGSGFMAHNNFYVVDKYRKQDKHKCKGDCSICNLCKHTRGYNIAVQKH